MESTEQYQELRERAEEAQRERQLAPVSLSMAVLAVFVAIVALAGHRAHTEEILLQNRATNQWSYYQAKNIRRNSSELFADLTSAAAFKNAEEGAKLKEKYAGLAEHYREELKEIEAEARKLEHESGVVERRANRFDLGEVFLEMGLVITSITLLTRRRAFWAFGSMLAVVGVVVAATALVVH